MQVACRLTGFKVADGDTWWYQIASSPWNDTYYASADAFYNNGQTSGSLKGTPFYDPKVPVCGTNSQGGTKETTGGTAHTWSNPANAGGTQGPTISAYATVSIACRLTGFKVADGNTWWYLVASGPWNSQFYVSADAFYNNGQTSGSLLGTPFVDANVPVCSSSNGGAGSPPPGFAETAGGAAHTWSDYADAGGTQGQTIAAFGSVQVTCKVTGFKVADGNTWWYQVASAPWNGSFYVSADAFYNNGHTSGSLTGTPFVDSQVPDCAAPGTPKPSGETAGGGASTWTNYTNAGGGQGPSVGSGTTVTVACRVSGFAVADGDSWWYRIASAPWDSLYYVSADAFYNNGQTSGSLQGTPFVDSSVPMCTTNLEEPAYGTAIGSASGAVNANRCNRADPVDCASGDFWQTFTDVSVPGRGPSLDLTRTYNSDGGAIAGIFGFGWSSTYDQHLTFNEDGSIAVTLADGSQVIAEPNGSGGYTVPSWADSSLTQNGDGTYTYDRQQQQFLTFAAGSLGPTGSSGGQLLSVGDLNGYTTTLAYSAGRLASVTDSSGRSIQVTVGANGLVTSVSDPLGRTTTYGYNSSGDLDSVTDPMNRTWSYSYDGSNQMVSITDPAGGITTNSYDSSGRVTQQTDPAGLTTTFAYTGDNFSALGGTTTVTDPHGNTESEQYANGFLTLLTKASGTPDTGTWTYTYDPSTFGVASVTNPDGNTASYTYDVAGQVLTTTDPTGAVTISTYNSLNEPLTTTDPMGHIITSTYDPNGNVLSVTQPMGKVTTYVYGDGHPGDVTAVTDPDGRVTTMTYDSYGNLASRSLSLADGTAGTTAYVYDADSEVICQVSADSTADGVNCPQPGDPRVDGTTTTSYDADGETTSVTDPDGHVTSYSYDANGNSVQVTDPSGNATTSTYDPDNRLISTTAGTNGDAPSTTTYQLDLAPGSGACPPTAGITYCSATKNPNGDLSVVYYNARDQMIDRSLPGGQTTQYTYDPAGNKTSTIDAANATTSYSYDADGRLTSVSYSEAGMPSVTYGYDADGQRSIMTDGTGATIYTYDDNGRLTSVNDGNSDSISYGYDNSGDVTTLTYPGGHVVTRKFDTADRLVSVTDWLGNTTTFGYDPSGNITTTGYPNGDMVTASYDPAGAATGTSITRADSTLAAIRYSRNADSLVTQETDSGALSGSISYAYSARNQLTSAGADSYGYDPAGNLTTQAAASQTYDSAGQLTASTPVSGQATSYTYDAIGDRTGASLASGTGTTYGYNQIGELTSVTQVSPVPAVTSVTPATGTAVGGGTVTITGSGFTGATAVTFGTTAAPSFTVDSDTQITATAPAQASGTVDITVTTPGGVSPAVPADQFSYLSGPAITAVAPAHGSVRGGTKVTITGSGFTGTSAVAFGSTPAASFTVDSSTTITATSPRQAAGTVDVTVTTPGGASPAVPADQFTYGPRPAITALAPAAGPVKGGTAVTITGTDLAAASSVRFGTKLAAFAVVSGSTITATSPAHSAGTVSVIVTTPAGKNKISGAAKFSYAPVPKVTSIEPTSGPAGGGTTVTITGTGMTGATAVQFGSTPASQLTVVSDTEITALSPGHAAGSASIMVTTAGGTSRTVTSDRFTYTSSAATASARTHTASGRARTQSSDSPTTTSAAGYSYNGDGLRMSETTSHETLTFAWDTTQTVPHVFSDGDNFYIYGPDGLPIEQISAAGDPDYFFHDSTGSTRALLDPSGAIGATFTYTPYGNLDSRSGTLTTPLLYGQGYTDQAAGLIYLVNRYYDPATGEFISVDPALDTSGQPYNYAEGDPLNQDDPLGLFCILGHNPNGSCRGSNIHNDAEVAKKGLEGVGAAAGVAAVVLTAPADAAALGVAVGIGVLATGASAAIGIVQTIGACSRDGVGSSACSGEIMRNDVSTLLKTGQLFLPDKISSAIDFLSYLSESSRLGPATSFERTQPVHSPPGSTWRVPVGSAAMPPPC